jgi:FkbH-like protein
VLNLIKKLIANPGSAKSEPVVVAKNRRKPQPISLPEDVKLVIWDLDETFWSGTLTEGPITPIPANIEIVKTLAERGIISSICSKNNHDDALAALTDLGIADYFVFPQIEFAPKGEKIAAILETAGLRAENTLFIDDNIFNLEEARHISPGLMTADPRDILPTLLTLPQLEGKPDPVLTRLAQYKKLEQKSAERAASAASNEDFLRGCDIRIEIDYEIEPHFDRIIELANRTNQLNFTKRRLESQAEIDKFRALLKTFGITAAIIRVADKYGDYGIVGFFVLRRKTNINKLLHFVFSCRTMNMGIEQYLYERLQKPDIKIVEPVANPIITFADVDWIAEGAAVPQLGAVTSAKKLLLVGGCELLQLASMCSSNRAEFVNTNRNSWTIRFDDPGFILGDRAVIEADSILPRLNYWTHEDTVQFDADLADSQIIIAALFNITTRKIFETAEGVRIRFAEENLQRWLREDGAWFNQNLTQLKINTAGKLDLIARCLDRMAARSPPEAARFALGVNTKKMAVAESLAADGWPENLQTGSVNAWLKALNNVGEGKRAAATRHVFNRYLQDYCTRTGNFTFIDVDAITALNDIHDPDPTTAKFLPDHLTRHGYITIATHIAEQLQDGD